jgi:hypothetical protein
LYAPTLLIFGNFFTIMVLIVCDDEILFCIAMYYAVILYTYIYCCV